MNSQKHKNITMYHEPDPKIEHSVKCSPRPRRWAAARGRLNGISTKVSGEVADNDIIGGRYTGQCGPK